MPARISARAGLKILARVAFAAGDLRGNNFLIEAIEFSKKFLSDIQFAHVKKTANAAW